MLAIFFLFSIMQEIVEECNNVKNVLLSGHSKYSPHALKILNGVANTFPKCFRTFNYFQTFTTLLTTSLVIKNYLTARYCC